MPVRILHVVTYMGRGGLETMLMNYYRRVDREKLQFDFLVHRDFEADYDAEILSLGGRIYQTSRLIPWSRSYRNELKAFFRAHPEYRIIHVHQDCLSSVILQCAEECGIPVRIAHSHAASQDKNLKYPIKLYYRRQIPQYATDLMACGRAAGDWMFRGAPYRTLCNAIEAEQYAFDENVRKQVRDSFGFGDRCVVGHTGRFSPQKNHNMVIEVFAECVKRNPDVRLLLVGDGDLRPEIEKKAADLGLADKIVFAGVRSDVNELLQAMDVFLFPSIYEGLSLAVIEAQAAGLPCVISDGVSDECVVTDGLVTVKKLADSPAGWAEEVLRQAALPRRDHSDEVRAAGYDVRTAAGALEAFYLQKAEEAGLWHS